MRVFTSASEKMRIDSSGNVGIGTTSPSTALEVDGTITFGTANSIIADNNLRFKSSGASYIDHNTVGQDINFRVSNASSLDTTALTIDSSGKIGIGTSSPSGGAVGGKVLHLVNSGGTASLRVDRSDASTTGTLSITSGNSSNSIYSTGNKPLNIHTNSTTRMTVDSSGNVGIGTTSPFSDLSVNVGTNAPSSSGDMAAEGLTVHYTQGGRALQLGVNESGAYNYIQSSYVNNANVAVNLAFFTGASERMRIASNGRVGIGTSSPSALFEIEHSSDAEIDLDCTGGRRFRIASTDANALIFSDKTGSAERMRINSSGSAFFGVTSEPTGSVGGSAFVVDSVGRMNLILATTSTGNVDVANFRNPNGTVGKINTNGSSTVYNTSSDARLKDVTGSARGLEVINELNPVSYNWKVDGKADEGLIAQEVLDIVPNAVSGSEEEQYYMDYSKLVVHLVKGMKEQQAQIEALQSEINLLKGE